MTGRDKLAVVFGGSGFVGRHTVSALAKRGYRVRAAVRRPDIAGFLQPMGVVGQVYAVQANLRYPDSVLADGALMQLALHRAHVVPSGPGVSSVPSYLLVLEDVDELEEAIFAAMNVNPRFFSGSLSAKAKECLLVHNLHASKW